MTSDLATNSQFFGFFSGCAHDMWKILGQGSNSCHMPPVCITPDPTKKKKKKKKQIKWISSKDTMKNIKIQPTKYTMKNIKIHLQNERKQFQIKNLRSSHHGTMGLAVSMECWGAGSNPGLSQWVKDPVQPQLCIGHSCGSDPISGPGIPHAMRWPKKRKKNLIKV